MKKVLILCSLMLTSVMAFAADPSQFLPGKAGFVLYADGLRLMTETGRMKTTPADPEVKAKIDGFFQILEKHSVTLTQIFSGKLFVVNHDDSKETAMFFATTIPEAKMQKLVEELLTLTGKEIQSEVVSADNHKVYTFARAGHTPDDGTITLCYSYLTPDVVFLFFREKSEVAGAFRDFIAPSGKSTVNQYDPALLYSIYWDLANFDLGNLAGGIRALGIERFLFAANNYGANKNDVDLVLEFDCTNAEACQALEVQSNILAQVLIGTAFAEDPSLAADLAKCMKTSSSGKVLAIAFKIDEALAKRIETYSASVKSLPALPTAPVVQNVQNVQNVQVKIEEPRRHSIRRSRGPILVYGPAWRRPALPQGGEEWEVPEEWDVPEGGEGHDAEAVVEAAGAAMMDVPAMDVSSFE